jgi:hypothetical protein
VRQSTTLKTRLSGSGTDDPLTSASASQSVQRSQSRFGRESQQGLPQSGDGGSGSPPGSPKHHPQSPHQRQGSQTQAEGLYEGVSDLSKLGISAEQLGDIQRTYVEWDACNKEALDIQMKLDTVRVGVRVREGGRCDHQEVWFRVRPGDLSCSQAGGVIRRRVRGCKQMGQEPMHPQRCALMRGQDCHLILGQEV